MNDWAYAAVFIAVVVMWGLVEMVRAIAGRHKVPNHTHDVDGRPIQP